MSERKYYGCKVTVTSEGRLVVWRILRSTAGENSLEVRKEVQPCIFLERCVFLVALAMCLGSVKCECHVSLELYLCSGARLSLRVVSQARFFVVFAG